MQGEGKTLNFLSLKYFLVVARESNITRAAQKICISQQSLSEHITRLEQEYGVKLFDRSPRLHLTYAGEQMVKLAEQALSLENQISNEMADISEQRRGSLSVGIRPTFSRILLPAVLPAFYNANPSVTLHITISHSEELLSLLMNGQLDLIVTQPRYASNESVISTKLFDDHYCMVIPENLLLKYFNLTGDELHQDTALDFEQFGKIPLLLSREGGETRSVVDAFLTEQGVTKPNILMETRDFEACFITCASGIGITFSFNQYYRHFAKNYAQRYPLYALPITSPARSVSAVVARYKGRYFSNTAKEFIKVTQQATEALMFSL